MRVRIMVAVEVETKPVSLTAGGLASEVEAAVVGVLAPYGQLRAWKAVWDTQAEDGSWTWEWPL